MARSSTTYPNKWRNSKTTVVRIPQAIADQVLTVAKRLDSAHTFFVREEANSIVIELQPPFRSIRYSPAQPVNIASVPQRSPFRYPGGKTWLVPFIRDWLRSKAKPPSRLIEPYAGGAIVSLTAAFEHLAKHVIFSEIDPSVSSVWNVVLNGQADWLAQQIMTFEVSFSSVRAILDAHPVELREQAFQTIIRNRMQRGGIMAAGAGLVKTGENGKGLLSRWYPETLARRIREINRIKDRLTFLNREAFAVIEEHQHDNDAALYIDPPYTQAARRLYTKWEVDHERLFALLAMCKGDFLMSYDNTKEIIELAKTHHFSTRAIAMKNTHHAKMTELLIGRDLSWLDR